VQSIRGVTVWLTGLPCAGKTTIAEHLLPALIERGRRVEVLDGDAVRRQLSAELGFSRADRDVNVRRIGAMAHLLTRHGVVVIVAAVSPYAEARRQAREQIGTFVEVYVHCPVEECERRDVKGMYKKARAGELTGFTGVDDPYEPPEHPELTLNTLEQTPEQSAANVLAALEALGYLSAGSSAGQ
jgi:adenylylsulfate kinase